MKYYIIAGEASGDLHGSNLMKALQVEDADAEFRFWGGDKMEAVGGQLVKHYRDLAFMGFVEVAKNIRTILKNFDICKSDVIDFNPDVLILIDYPGFNLRIAKWAKQKGIRIFYYISPQIWAWNTSRVHAIKKNVERMFVILPFEKSFYQKYDWEVDFVGHPLLDVINQIEPSKDFLSKNNLSDNKIIALLPGSRKQEIIKMLEVMLSVINDFPDDYQFVIAGAPSIPISFYKNILQKLDNQQISVVTGQTHDLLQNSHAALVTSGTATLETALFNIPQVVCYKGGAVNYQIAKRVIKVKYISLVNLIVEHEIVKELIQDEFNANNLKLELEKILSGATRQKVLDGYLLLQDQLGNSGASERTAKLMVDYVGQFSKTDTST